MALVIPEPLQDAVIKLFGFPKADRDELLTTLKNVKPTTNINTYVIKVGQLLPQYAARELLEVVQFIFSFHSLSDTDRDPDKVVKDFMQAFISLDVNVGKQISREELTSFANYAREILLASESLSFGARAAVLSAQYERIFGYAEIFTDMRGLFSQQKPSSEPTAASIVHSLKIHSYVSDEHEDLHVALDYSDLLKLKEVVERALEKHKGLSAMMSRAGIEYVGPVEEGS